MNQCSLRTIVTGCDRSKLLLCCRSGARCRMVNRLLSGSDWGRRGLLLLLLLLRLRRLLLLWLRLKWWLWLQVDESGLARARGVRRRSGDRGRWHYAGFLLSLKASKLCFHNNHLTTQVIDFVGLCRDLTKITIEKLNGTVVQGRRLRRRVDQTICNLFPYRVNLYTQALGNFGPRCELVHDTIHGIAETVNNGTLGSKVGRVQSVRGLQGAYVVLVGIPRALQRMAVSVRVTMTVGKRLRARAWAAGNGYDMAVRGLGGDGYRGW